MSHHDNQSTVVKQNCLQSYGMTINVIGVSNSQLILKLHYENQSAQTCSSIILQNFQVSMISSHVLIIKTSVQNRCRWYFSSFILILHSVQLHWPLPDCLKHLMYGIYSNSKNHNIKTCVQTIDAVSPNVSGGCWPLAQSSNDPRINWLATSTAHSADLGSLIALHAGL